MIKIILVILVLDVVCYAHPTTGARHLTPIGGLISHTAEKLLHPFGTGRGGSHADSHSFSIGGSFLGII